MTKLKLKVWIALLTAAYELILEKDIHQAKYIKSIKKECEVKLLEEYKEEVK